MLDICAHILKQLIKNPVFRHKKLADVVDTHLHKFWGKNRIIVTD
jgi:hypothetical protein